jgi:hypothetical protein
MAATLNSEPACECSGGVGLILTKAAGALVGAAPVLNAGNFGVHAWIRVFGLRLRGDLFFFKSHAIRDRIREGLRAEGASE